MSYNLIKEERETIINYNETDDKANIYTRSRITMTKLDKLVKKNPKDYVLVEEYDHSKEYECDKKLIGFRTSRNFTEKQRKVLSDRMTKTMARR